MAYRDVPACARAKRVYVFHLKATTEKFEGRASEKKERLEGLFWGLFFDIHIRRFVMCL